MAIEQICLVILSNHGANIRRKIYNDNLLSKKIIKSLDLAKKNSDEMSELIIIEFIQILGYLLADGTEG